MLAEVLDRHILDRGEVRIAGVVDDHVQSPEHLHRHLYCGLRSGVVRHIEPHRANLIAVLGDEIVELLRATRGRDELMAYFEHRLGDRAAETA